MERINRKYIKILAVILLAAGLFYAYFNVLNTRFKGSASRKQMRQISGQMMFYPENSDRIECDSTLYIVQEEGQEPVEISSGKMQFILDQKYKRLQIHRENAEEIIEFSELEEEAYLSGKHAIHMAAKEGGQRFVSDQVYSKGVSPLYIREEEGLKKVQKEQWYHYSCREIYGVKWYEGLSERISYGYLTSEEYLEKIRHQKTEKTREDENPIEDTEKEGSENVPQEAAEEAAGETAEYLEESEEYIVQIKNTLRSRKASGESDNEFRKTLSENGLHVMKLKKEYPDVYKMLKEIYYQSAENLHVWLDAEGKMIRIEKDYTFPYYMEVMKENSEKIEQLVGRYHYPRIICRQDYLYSPSCQNVSLPRVFKEL
ncbi:MAG: hypothetical protein HFH24_08385 [Ruminococcus sp.]|nr:hypothetical protein [Ruminococcus sp.]